MTFTDDHLKNLKERLILDRSTAVGNSFPTDEIDMAEALLARLEAAERVCEVLSDQLRADDELDDHEELAAWRKAAGR